MRKEIKVILHKYGVFTRFSCRTIDMSDLAHKSVIVVEIKEPIEHKVNWSELGKELYTECGAIID